jgi:glycosyltransferase involved in cell wall biosynthesis
MNKRKLKIMWLSNHPEASSGYSQQTQDIKKKLLESGWDGSNLSFINTAGQYGYKEVDKDGILNFPTMDHVQGSDAMIHHMKRWGGDIIISLLDIWVLNPQDLQQVPNWIPWTPIDYDPVPKPILNNLRFANRIIAMSKFGQKQLQENGLTASYIPHHVDTSIFYPVDKKKRKTELKIDPNTFIFGMVSANKDLLPRKSFGQVLQVFQQFHAKHPNSLLYIHTNPDQPGGYPIRAHADYLGLTQAVGFPDRYKLHFDTPKSEMNQIYNAFDCLLSPSSTEGFGIPIIEAQATGTPAIVTDYTAMPELITEQTGFKVKTGCEHFMPIGGYMKFPDTQDLYEKMEMAFSSNLVAMGHNAHKWVKENFDLNKVWGERWLPFLEKLEIEKYGLTPTPEKA